MSIDLNRRFFIFGTAAQIIAPPVRTFHFLTPRIVTVSEFLTERGAPWTWTEIEMEMFAKIQRIYNGKGIPFL